MTDINPILPEITVIVRALHSKQKAESGRIGLKKKKSNYMLSPGDIL